MNTEKGIYQVYGGTASSGSRYFLGLLDDFWIKASVVALRNGLEEALSYLQIVTTPDQRKQLIEQMSQVRDFRP